MISYCIRRVALSAGVACWAELAIGSGQDAHDPEKRRHGVSACSLTAYLEAGALGGSRRATIIIRDLNLILANVVSKAAKNPGFLAHTSPATGKSRRPRHWGRAEALAQ
ncbi:hypothetical protein K504DRAFT_497356 [Pleomassaria siparia CBS 279.74]|uniref:Uncharacterized protein n=1 Tax=Pleomassaria siparia CBS 279.74 TaxID=1314801 RepID=A0A6G1KS86_9PLEO|nr:hypothetical protein K504DRAFT_497356 [Pleomassaria siparia CBS 279.74]